MKFSYAMIMVITSSLAPVVFAGGFNAKLQMFNGGLLNVKTDFDFDEELDRLEKIANDLPVGLREQAELFISSKALKGFMADTSEQINEIVKVGITCGEAALKSSVHETVFSRNNLSKKCIREVGEECPSYLPTFLCPDLNLAQKVRAELCEFKSFAIRNAGSEGFLVNVSNKSEDLAKSGSAIFYCGTIKVKSIAEVSLEAMWLRESLEYFSRNVKSTCNDLHSCFMDMLSHAKEEASSMCDTDVRGRMQIEHDKLDLISADDADVNISGVMRAYLTIKAKEFHIALIQQNNAIYTNMMKKSCNKADVKKKGGKSIIEFNEDILVSNSQFENMAEYFTSDQGSSCLSPSARDFKQKHYDKILTLNDANNAERLSSVEIRDCDGEVQILRNLNLHEGDKMQKIPF